MEGRRKEMEFVSVAEEQWRGRGNLVGLYVWSAVSLSVTTQPAPLAASSPEMRGQAIDVTTRPEKNSREDSRSLAGQIVDR
jgi:hypothetical protein